MEEITNILSMTQMRLSKFKVFFLFRLDLKVNFYIFWLIFQKACGSLTNLMRIRGFGDGNESDDAESNPTIGESHDNAETNPPANAATDGTPSKQDMQQKISALLTKTGNAHNSLRIDQNK